MYRPPTFFHTRINLVVTGDLGDLMRGHGCEFFDMYSFIVLGSMRARGDDLDFEGTPS